MKTQTSFRHSTIVCSLFMLLAALAWTPAHARVLDNFDDNTKTAWQDFTFIPGFGLPVENSGQFRFALPPAGQAIFTASQKTSEVFELKEGRTVEFRVDVEEAGGKDSFAVLAFLPLTIGGNPNSPGTLAGYGLAKSTTDVLITKGIGRYFVADDGPTADLKNNLITLVLTLTVKDGNVIVTGKALDKENNNAVLWERTVVDTPAADVMADGDDSPKEPFITTGYFTLYCYEDFSASAPEDPYFVYYDNAEVYVTETSVLDDFDDNTKTAWQDFTFIPGFGLPKEENQQFRFALPPAGQAIFTASQKTSRVFELKEGERHEFSVDVEEAGGKDSFAVLAFLPLTIGGNPNSPGTLAGYGLAKSTTDVLITKGIGRYFVADDGPTADLKNNLITLVLTMTVKDGNVIITGKALDKENNNAVLWERTVVDTPATDVMADGEDSPKEPFITTGYFTLYCYEDFSASAPEDPYFVYYDNAIVAAPPAAANEPPIISEVLPAEFANFLPASTQISFKVADDKALADDKISVTLNGTLFTTANGLAVAGSGGTKTATLGGLAANVNYTAMLSAEDSDGVRSSRTLYFDTFAEDSLVLEIEDYNLTVEGVGGKFFDNPVPIAEGGGPQDGSYSYQTGTQDIDFNETRPTPQPQTTLYRPNDPIRMQHSLDAARAKFTAAGGTAAGVYDYDVGDIAEGEWLNYTRTFPAGSYEAYLRQAVVNMTSGESVLEQVTGDPSQPSAATKVLGSFLGARTGFQYRNFALTDGTGQNKIIVRLSGVTTLRLRQVTPDPGDGARYQTYLLLTPVQDPGLQRATISSLSPAPGSTVETVTPAIRVEIQNRDTTVNTDSIKLQFNGQEVARTVTSDANGAVITYSIPVAQLPAPGANNTAQISFKDNLNVEVSSEWNFVVNYLALDPANRQPGPGTDRGLKARFVQAPDGTGLANDLQPAESQLAPNSPIPVLVDFTETIQVVNMAQDERVSGFFEGESLVPGLQPDVNGTEFFAVEIKAWLELSAGIYRFGVVTDDGYKVSSGKSPNDKEPLIAFHNGGPANETFDFVVQQAGFYPFRFMWYEYQGNAYAEWFSVNTATSERTLINDPNTPTAIKAYLDVQTPVPTVKLESAEKVTGPYAVEGTATINTDTKTITITRAGDTRFYRLNAASALRVKTWRLTSTAIELVYE